MASFTCCFCRQTDHGYGNNPWPFKAKGKCCDVCNRVVVAARVADLCGGKEFTIAQPGLILAVRKSKRGWENPVLVREWKIDEPAADVATK